MPGGTSGSRWISRSNSKEWWGANSGSRQTIGNVSRKGSTILVNRPVSLAHQSSSLFGKPSCTSTSAMNHAFQESDSVNDSTVPGTFLEHPRRIFDSQVSSLGGTPRWAPPTTGDAAPSNLNVPSQVEVRQSMSTLGSTRRDSIHSTCDNGNDEAENWSAYDREIDHSSPTFASTFPPGDSPTVATGLMALSRPDNRSRVLANVTNLPNGAQSTMDIPEWDGCNPNFIMKRMKAIPRLELQSWGKREFYKSYSSWEKMTPDQRNKALSYFRGLPEEVQGISATSCFPIITCYWRLYFNKCFVLFFSEQLVEEAISDALEAAQTTTVRNTQTTKDDIVRLIHLFKEPSAQKHWCNLRRVMSRAELDARKASAVYNEACNPLTYLAEIYNDYDDFRPQNLMVQYVPGPHGVPIKKTPYQASQSEWAFLANFTHDLEPTNVSRRDIIRGEDWIKSTWTDCRKYLHQMFTNYNRSGQHDDDVDEWGSEKELQRWSRAASWKPKSSSQGTIIRYTSAMIYSIAVLDLADFEGIGRKMPKGTGVDATINNGAQSSRHRTKRRKTTNRNKADSSGSIIEMLKDGDKKDQQLVALRIFFESGTAEEKQLAQNALLSFAFPSDNNNDTNKGNNNSSCNDAITFDDRTDDETTDAHSMAGNGNALDDDESNNSVLNEVV